jgi:hypothetical protein
MENVCIKAVADWHKFLSPVCTCRKMSDLKIPLDQDDPSSWIGKETTNIPPDGPTKKPGVKEEKDNGS